MDGTSVASATARMSDLAAQPDPVLMRGTSLRVLVSGFDARWPAPALVARYVGDRGLSPGHAGAGHRRRLGDPRPAARAASGAPCCRSPSGARPPSTYDGWSPARQDLIADPVVVHRHGRPPLLLRRGTASAARPGDAGAHHPRRRPPLDGARHRRETPGVRVVGRGRRGAVPGSRRQPARPAAGPPRAPSAPWPPPGRWWWPGPTPRAVGAGEAARRRRRRPHGVRLGAGRPSTRRPRPAPTSLALLVAVGVALVALTHLAGLAGGPDGPPPGRGRRPARRRPAARASSAVPTSSRRSRWRASCWWPPVVAAAATTTALLRPDAPGRRLGRRAGRRPRGPALGARRRRARGGRW